MKIIQKQLRPITLLLVYVILLQSCKATYHDSFSWVLFKTSQTNKRVIIETKDSLSLEYNRVDFVDSTYLGIQRIHGKKIKTPINLENIKSVETKSKVMLDVVEIVGVIVITGLIVTYLYGKYIACWEELQD
ncbi:hypothetical protein ACS386_04835 [Flavobacteriaceae bacterium LMO-SS05]